MGYNSLSEATTTESIEVLAMAYAVMVKHTQSNTREAQEHCRVSSKAIATKIAKSLMKEKYLDRFDKNCPGKRVPRYALVYVCEA